MSEKKQISQTKSNVSGEVGEKGEKAMHKPKITFGKIKLNTALSIAKNPVEPPESSAGKFLHKTNTK